MEKQHLNGDSIVKFQSLWRGFRTRKWVEETRRDYEDVFTNIQRNFNLDTRLVWCSSIICPPHFSDQLKQTRTDEDCPGLALQQKVDVAKKVEHLVESKSSCTLSDDDDCSVNFMSVTKCKSDVDSFEKQSRSHSNDNANDTRPSEFSKHTEDTCASHPSTSNETKRKDSLLLGGVDELSSGSAKVSIRSSDKFDHDSIYGGSEKEFNSLNGVSVEIDALEFVETSSRILETDNVLISAGVENDSWMTLQSSSVAQDMGTGLDKKSQAELEKMKENLSLELLWIGQAITSRKSYLKMKNGLC